MNLRSRRIALTTAAAWAALLFSNPPPARAELFWHPKYSDALKEARESGKPIFLEFRCAP